MSTDAKNSIAQMEKIVSLCKRRGFIFQSSEIYGGCGGVWDYGPLGAELKRNLRTAWWNTMTREREDVLGQVRTNAPLFRATLDRVQEACPMVGDVRGDGFFWALELVTDRATKGEFTPSETEELIRGFLSPRLFEEGLLCRADDRGDPVLQFSPPLVMGAQEFEVMESALIKVLNQAWDRLGR